MSEEKEPKKSRTNWFVMLANSVAVLALLLAYFATHFPPKSIGYLSLFGLAYPASLLLNFGFIVYWLFKKPKYALVSAFAIVIGLNHFTDFFQISLGKPETTKVNHMKVLTYNVRNFGLYSAEGKKEIRNKIFDVLDRENADLVCFQEFFHSDKKGYFTTRDSLLKFLPTKYYHERYTHAMKGQNYFGVALFSKYPIVNKGFVPFENDPNNFCIYADLKVEGDTIRVYDAHLQSIRFKPEDYAFVDQNRNEEELDQGSKRIARRLKLAFQKRQLQVDRVVQSIADSPHPVILCGDFNDPPVSYTYEAFTDLLEDSFCEAGSGIGNTYIGVFPSFRIDYILHSKELEAIEYKTLDEKLSDHHAVVATLAY
jgi:endonuclease/exonuclease/phosphatase family metal-dependent hydrolase